MSADRPGPAKVLPSLMSADPLRVGELLDGLVGAGARAFHVDVMDGRFVPNLTLGTDFARGAAGPVHEAGGLIDVHLMVERPGHLIGLFAEAADAISVHYEADPHPHRLLARIREAGCLAGLALNPGTPVAVASELEDVLDYVNVLAIDPGLAGQRFLARTLERLADLRDRLPERIALEVDGGIDRDSLPGARSAGASLLVSASAIFGADDPVASYRELAGLAAG